VIPDPVETTDAWRAGRLAELVRRVLEPLLGEPFMDLGRAADMVWMGFGDVVAAPTRRDPERRSARHRIHVSCPLRLDSRAAVLIASSDIYRPGQGRDESMPFEWDKPGANLFDASVAAFWAEHEPGSSVLESVDADAFGGLQLGLSSGHAIKIFPNRSGADEHWRYFEIDGGDHFVVLPKH
jgi:hypothetical protein